MNRMRRRFAALRMHSPLDRWCALALLFSLTLGWCSMALALRGTSVVDPWAMTAIAGLLLLPRLAALLRDFTARQDPHGIGAVSLQWLGGLLCAWVLFWPATLVTLLAWMHGLAAARPRRDGALALALALGVVEALVPLLATHSPEASALFVLQLFVASLGGTWLHARATRRRFLTLADARFGEPEDRVGLSARTLTLAALTMVVALAVALFEGGVAAVEAGRAAGAADPRIAGGGGVVMVGAGGDADRPAATADEDPATAETRRRERAERLRSVWPDELALDGELAAGQERIMAQVQCTLDRGDEPWYGPDRPLYLRARTYEQVGAQGLHHGPEVTGEVYTDAGTGVEDGWVELLRLRSRRAAALYGIKVREHVLQGDRYTDRHRAILLHTAPLLRVELPSVREVPGEGYFAVPGDSGILQYKWTTASWNEARPIADPTAAPGRLLDLPADDPRFTAWAAEGRRIAAGAADREEALARVLACFEDGWTYSRSPSPGLQGMDALEAFFAQRRGYCVSYATAVLIYLRGAGVPCRVVTGYRATRWERPDPERPGMYVVYNSDAHAWVEVALEGGHWRTIEPTPREAYEAAFAAVPADAEPIPEDEAATALAGTEEAAPVDGRSPWTRWLEGFQRWMGMDSFATAYGGRAFIIALVLALSVGLHLLTLMHLGRLRRKAAAPPSDDPVVGYWRELVSVLRGYGFHPRRGQTPREYAQQVRSYGGPLFAGIEQVVDVLYRDRFGGLGLAEADRSMIEAYRGTLESEAFRSRWKRTTRA